MINGMGRHVRELIEFAKLVKASDITHIKYNGEYYNIDRYSSDVGIFIMNSSEEYILSIGRNNINLLMGMEGKVINHMDERLLVYNTNIGNDIELFYNGKAYTFSSDEDYFLVKMLLLDECKHLYNIYENIRDIDYPYHIRFKLSDVDLLLGMYHSEYK